MNAPDTLSEHHLKPVAESEAPQRPPYETPRLTVMRDDDVLRAFRTTAPEIGAAGCGWSASSWGGVLVG